MSESTLSELEASDGEQNDGDLAMRKIVTGILRIRSFKTLKMMIIPGWQVYRIAVKFVDDMPLHAARSQVYSI